MWRWGPVHAATDQCQGVPEAQSLHPGCCSSWRSHGDTCQKGVGQMEILHTRTVPTSGGSRDRAGIPGTGAQDQEPQPSSCKGTLGVLGEQSTNECEKLWGLGQSKHHCLGGERGLLQKLLGQQRGKIGSGDRARDFVPLNKALGPGYSGFCSVFWKKKRRVGVSDGTVFEGLIPSIPKGPQSSRQKRSLSSTGCGPQIFWVHLGI